MNMNALLLAMVLVLVAACEEQINPKQCDYDSDCICGGKDAQTGDCFLGNKEYYDRFVDKEGDCPDFCGGIAGNLELKCVSNQCVQQRRSNLPPILNSPICGNQKCEAGEDSCPFSCPKNAVCEIDCGPIYCPEDCGKPFVSIDLYPEKPVTGQVLDIILKPEGQFYARSYDDISDFSVEKLEGEWRRIAHKETSTTECRDNELYPIISKPINDECVPLEEQKLSWNGRLLYQREKWCRNASYSEDELVPADPGHYRIVYRYHTKQDCGDNPVIAIKEFDVVRVAESRAPNSLSGECTTSSDCATGGCSGQVCAQKDKVKDIITTCEYTQEYECLKTAAKCSCLEGKCTWNKGEEYSRCIAG